MVLEPVVFCCRRRFLLSVPFSCLFCREQHPVGPERHLDAARQKLPRDNFCRSIAAQLPSPMGAILKEEKMSSIVGERQFGRHIKRQFGCEGNCESKIAARQWGVKEGPARHQDVSQGPLGKHFRVFSVAFCYVHTEFSPRTENALSIRTQWARRDRLMSRGKNFCLSLVSQLPSPRG